jgi:DNA repair protein RecN (Recombination protein N)
MARPGGGFVIESISIRNLGVISEAELEFGQGFTALTGETGAGKTMVLTALNLLLGGRADSGSIRTGETQLQVSGTWVVTNPELKAELLELGADLEDSRLIVSRTLSSDGRSKALLGGISVPISTLSQFAERLVAVHGQSDQLRLKSPAAQREALDTFGNYSAELAAYSSAYRSYRDLEARLERMRSAGAADQARISILREQIYSIESLNIQLEELEDISARIERLSNVESLRVSATLAHDALSSDGELDALIALGVSRKALESSSDPVLSELAGRLRELGNLTQEVASDLASYLHDLDADPAQLDVLMERRAAIISLERKYGRTAQELSDSLPQLQAELLDLDSSDEQVEKLEMQLEASLSQLGQAARALTAARTKAALELAESVTAELGQLAMGGSRLIIQVAELADFEASGNDRVEFLLAAFSGAEPRALSKGASGGELSRIMLAIELVLAGPTATPTMIFDEVDAGVGGQAAVELGRRLSKLSQSTQVLVVTHLAQVAAFAGTQIRVMKNSDGSVTESQVSVLGENDREIELARMLSGNSDSAVALEHARELLQSR